MNPIDNPARSSRRFSMPPFLRFFILLSLGLLPLGVAGQITISSTTYSSSQNVTVSSATSIATSGTVTVSTGAKITFKGKTTITLSPGFQATSGAKFSAIIDYDGDGISDAWELARGLITTDASDALSTTSNGLTYLMEYLLGTTPGATKDTTAGAGITVNVHRPSTP